VVESDGLENRCTGFRTVGSNPTLSVIKYKDIFNMTKKIKVAILYGGKSAEHSVSLESARNVVRAIDKDKYDIVLIGITKTGEWFLQDIKYFLENKSASRPIRTTTDRVIFLPQSNGEIYNITNPSKKEIVDIVFPVLHGTYGEDGSIQGLLRIANVPFVGSSVLSSAICMDKDVTKRLLRDAGIPIVDYIAYSNITRVNNDEILFKFGTKAFIKPADSGSSIGTSKINNSVTLTVNIKKAFKYGKKVLIEELIEGREIECGVIGNKVPKASCLGEIIPNDEYYSYEAKYIKKDGAKIIIPADIDKEKSDEIRFMARKAYEVLGCEGFARVDFFLLKDGRVFVNEVNTIPGFTSISMFPKLWEESGMPYSKVIDRLITLGLENFYKERAISLNY